MSTFTLSNGAKIPAVGFGTYDVAPEETYNAVLHALKSGYRHIDGAFFYRNEEQLGKAVKDSGIPREEIFITTKLWATQARDPAAALDLSLKKLGVDYVDLYLVHWPVARIPDPKDEYGAGLDIDKDLDFVQIWHKFQELPKSKARALGVSNYTSTKIQKILDHPDTKIKPVVNQVELHPQLPQDHLLEFSKKNNIQLEAYSPLAQGNFLNPTIEKIAKKHNADPGQVALSWNVQRGVVVLPRSVKSHRIESNLKIIKLDDEDIKEITSVATSNPKRYVVPPIFGDNLFENEVDK